MSRPGLEVRSDERRRQRMIDRHRLALAVVAVWVGCAALLTAALQESEPLARAMTLSAVIVGLSAATAHLAIFCRRLPGPTWRRWGLVVISIGACSLIGHSLLRSLGMVQSLTQDFINFAVITGIALVVQEGLSGHRARVQLQRQAQLLEDMERYLQGLASAPSPEIWVKVGHSERRVDPNAVSHVEADGNFTRLWLGAEFLFVSETLKDLVERLSDHDFVRIHKSHAVNANWVQERRSEDVVLRTGQRLRIGRAYQDEAREALETSGERQFRR